MTQPDQESESRNTRFASWLVPATLGAVVSVAGIVQGCLIAQSAQKSEVSLEVAKIKLQIIQSINAYDFRTAQVLMVHVLKPIDDGNAYGAFEGEFLELIAKRAPEALPSAQAELQTIRIASIEATNIGTLTGDFRGSQRLTASNKLVELHRQRPTEVVDGLLGALLPEEDSASYRVNLYTVFTLARLESHWSGTAQQLERIKALRGSRNYRDPTFRKRVEEAISNWAPRSS